MPTPVPMTPEEFDRMIVEKHFTAKKTDVRIVQGLYRNVWDTKLCNKTDFVAFHWKEAEVRQFIQKLHYFDRMEKIGLIGPDLTSTAAFAQLKDACERQGISLFLINSS